MGIVGLADVDITLHKSEIFGIAGVAGNGQNLLAEVIAGLRDAEAGNIVYKGQDAFFFLYLKQQESSITSRTNLDR